MEKNIYQLHGFADRDAYLDSLAVEYYIPIEDVKALAFVLGKNEDFDGLINALEDYCKNDYDDIDAYDYDDIDTYDLY